MSSPFECTQASASCPGVHAFLSASSLTFSTSLIFCSHRMVWGTFSALPLDAHVHCSPFSESTQHLLAFTCSKAPAAQRGCPLLL